MMTFVLHGGATSKDTPDNDYFFRQFTSLVSTDDVKIVLCYWARPKEKWEELSNRDQNKVLSQTNKRVSFAIAEDVPDLYKKLEIADVLYVAGGEAELIEPHLPLLSDLKTYLQGKVYLGSSMGAFIVSENYVLSFDSQDDNSAHRGLGIVPINTLCHWDVENKKNEKLRLLEQSSRSPVITLDECRFVIMYL